MTVVGPFDPGTTTVEVSYQLEHDSPDLTLSQTYEDAVLLIASALAFVTVLSLIPLLSAFSFVGARVFSQYSQRSLEVFVQVAPFLAFGILLALMLGKRH